MAATPPPTTLDVSGVIEETCAEQYCGLSERQTHYGDANLNIAKIYLHSKRDLRKATDYLIKTCRSRRATEGSKEEARQLLWELKSKKAKRTGANTLPKGAAGRASVR